VLPPPSLFEESSWLPVFLQLLTENAQNLMPAWRIPAQMMESQPHALIICLERVTTLVTSMVPTAATAPAIKTMATIIIMRTAAFTAVGVHCRQQ
jgi:hypothetical protein